MNNILVYYLWINSKVLPCLLERVAIVIYPFLSIDVFISLTTYLSVLMYDLLSNPFA